MTGEHANQNTMLKGKNKYEDASMEYIIRSLTPC